MTNRSLFSLFRQPAFQLPIKNESSDIVGLLRARFETVCNALDTTNPLHSDSKLIFDELSSERESLREWANGLIDVLEIHLTGKPGEAYNKFADLIDAKKQWLQSFTYDYSEPRNFLLLFRVRSGVDYPCKREDLFHIPFEDRHLVSTQRFSIPGIPCLYLSGSIFTCWAEMHRPVFSDLTAAAFWLGNSSKPRILDLNLRPKRTRIFINEDDSLFDNTSARMDVIRQIALWPLIAMCTIVVGKRNAPFKAEYLFPQTVLQWITQEQLFDGLCYFSTHVNLATHLSRKFCCNFVFPAKNFRSVGRCSFLRDTFRMTKPENWQILRTTPLHGFPDSYFNSMLEIEIIDGYKQCHYETEFGKVESSLCKLAADLIHRSGNDQELGKVMD